MSNYAELVDNKVVRVLVIDNSWTDQQAQEFLSTISSNTWMNVESYSRYVSKDDEFHPQLNKFIPEKPFNSWILDEDRGMYLPPIIKPLAIPVGYVVLWSEELKRWILEKVNV